MRKKEQLRESKKKTCQWEECTVSDSRHYPTWISSCSTFPPALPFLFLLFFLFLPLPSGPPALLTSISSPVLHLHSFLNHVFLTNLINHVECLNENSLEGPKSFGHGLSNSSCLGMLWAPNKYKNNHPTNRILNWKVVNSRALPSFCQVCWFADSGAVKTL